MTSPELPAWSEPFTNRRRELRRSLRIKGVTREWAWGGAAGAGVRVGIIDSGLENAHPRLRGRVAENVTVEMTGLDVETDVIVAAEVYEGTAGDCSTIEDTVSAARTNLREAKKSLWLMK